jgi:hypothetical protein
MLVLRAKKTLFSVKFTKKSLRYEIDVSRIGVAIERAAWVMLRLHMAGFVSETEVGISELVTSLEAD